MTTSINAYKSSSFLSLLVCLICVTANATQVISITTEKMSQQAEVIIHGRVLGQKVHWDKTHTRILTLSQIEIIEKIKGPALPTTITLYQVGGRLDGLSMHILGALKFNQGEEIVLFAETFEDMIVTFGVGLGKYLVSERNAIQWIEPVYGDVAFVQPGPQGLLNVEAAPPNWQPKTLSQFLEQLRRAQGSGGDQ